MQDKLTILKLNLQIANNSMDEYLSGLLSAAAEFISKEGITLTDSIEDNQLIVIYAAWLYRKRADNENGMPRMLRLLLNNRLFSQKAGE